MHPETCFMRPALLGLTRRCDHFEISDDSHCDEAQSSLHLKRDHHGRSDEG